MRRERGREKYIDTGGRDKEREREEKGGGERDWERGEQRKRDNRINESSSVRTRSVAFLDNLGHTYRKLETRRKYSSFIDDDKTRSVKFDRVFETLLGEDQRFFKSARSVGFQETLDRPIRTLENEKDFRVSTTTNANRYFHWTLPKKQYVWLG